MIIQGENDQDEFCKAEKTFIHTFLWYIERVSVISLFLWFPLNSASLNHLHSPYFTFFPLLVILHQSKVFSSLKNIVCLNFSLDLYWSRIMTKATTTNRSELWEWGTERNIYLNILTFVKCCTGCCLWFFASNTLKRINSSQVEKRIELKPEEVFLAFTFSPHEDTTGSQVEWH